MNIDKSKLQPLLWAVVSAWKAGDQDLHLRTDALDEFLGESTMEEVALGLLAENERLAANLKLNLCDYPAIHDSDLDLLIASVEGASQIELAKASGCTPPNISRKVRRVKQRLGWQEGMGSVEIRARAEQLRALASQGAVVAADLMVERDQLKVENEALRKQVLNLSPFNGVPRTGPDTRCLACGEHHYGIGGLPCPKMKVTAQAVAKEAFYG